MKPTLLLTTVDFSEEMQVCYTIALLFVGCITAYLFLKSIDLFCERKSRKCNPYPEAEDEIEEI